jgi:hypothetical protein
MTASLIIDGHTVTLEGTPEEVAAAVARLTGNQLPIIIGPIPDQPWRFQDPPQYQPPIQPTFPPSPFYPDVPPLHPSITCQLPVEPITIQ